MRRVTLAVAILLNALWLAGCGGGATPTQPAAPASETINVVMHDIYYGDSNDNQQNPPKWTVTSGAQVTVNLDNQGALQHNWAVVKQGVDIPTPFDEEANQDLLLFDAGVTDAGTQKSETFTAPAPGEYVVICTVPGHYPAMQGRLVVQ
jgi:uncharacterized cupredoxin-like copper-binding protein